MVGNIIDCAPSVSRPPLVSPSAVSWPLSWACTFFLRRRTNGVTNGNNARNKTNETKQNNRQHGNIPAPRRSIRLAAEQKSINSFIIDNLPEYDDAPDKWEILNNPYCSRTGTGHTLINNTVPQCIIATLYVTLRSFVSNNWRNELLDV